MKKIKNIWHSLIYHSGIQGHSESKQEVIFNLIIISGIIYLAIAGIIFLVVGFIAFQLYDFPIEQSIAYTGVNFIIISLLALFYKVNSKHQGLLFKILAYYLAILYIFSICILSGPEAKAEILIYGIIPFPFFVMGRERKKIAFLATLGSFIFIFLVHIWYQYFPPIFPLPKQMLTYVHFIPIIFNIIIITFCSYQFISTAHKAEEEVKLERNKSNQLLLNILPGNIAEEIIEKGYVTPSRHQNVCVLFTDFVGFTKISEKMSPSLLVKELDECFSYFDSVIERYGLEKLKTIGDSYMCAGGIPLASPTYAINCALAALKMREYMNRKMRLRKKRGEKSWEIRIGIHCGQVVAGVIGTKKFAYDIWGDTVNTASRMESSGAHGQINISETAYLLLKDYFQCKYRGKVKAKNKGFIEMYFLSGITPEYSIGGKGRAMNQEFQIICQNMTEKMNGQF